MRARSALFTVFGDVVLPSGGEAWLGALSAAMGTLGISAQATRTALHRMASEGWVAAQRHGRYAAYRLTVGGVQRLRRAAERIYRLRSNAWNGDWHLLLLVDPGAATDPGEATRALRWTGFGQLDAHTWVSPHGHGDILDQVLHSHGLHQAARRFTTDAASPPDSWDHHLVSRAWDLEGLGAGYRAFVRRWEAAAIPAAARDAFGFRIRLVHDWRKFLFTDPGLPTALLPPDWAGDEAAGCFRQRYQAVEPAAWSWWAEVSAKAADRPVRSQPAIASPFADGLAALAARHA